MSLFRSTLRPPSESSDVAVRRYLLAARARIEPDPLFRRRLRGLVMNRHVAVREGLDRPAATRSHARAMGAIGRACLYASVALAASVGGTMAASQGALPGDALYPVKRQVEALRLQALPAAFHDDLAVYMLSERISEMTRLAEAGDAARAASLVPAIEAGYARLSELGVDAPGSDVLGARLVVLEALHERLPDAAQAAVERAVERGTGHEADAAQPVGPPSGAYGRDARERLPAAGPLRTEGEARPDDQASAADGRSRSPGQSRVVHVQPEQGTVEDLAE